jgi:hypothetical protein
MNLLFVCKESHGRWHRVPVIALVLLVILSGASVVRAFPLDGDKHTGITRLEGYRLAQEGKVHGHKLPAGALLKTEQVDLRLLNYPDLTLPEPDPQFSKQIRSYLGAGADRYGFAVLDLTNPEHPRYAEHRGTVRNNPGSVGKLIIALGIFQALADIYPDDTVARLKVLRTSMVTADGFIISDHHKVPLWNSETLKFRHRPIQTGDTANLWTYLDWMLSASSNAAASMVMEHLMLMVHFGRTYPVIQTQADQFFSETPKKELAALLEKALQSPVARNGLDLEMFRQGSFFTRAGKQKVPGTTSHASSRELVRFLLKLEQGKIVDPFSSREIKRLLYMTQRRIRYASAPALADSAVYFKSGSLYKCEPEPDFVCKKYHGNVVNMMNSVAVVEAPAEERQMFYMTAVMSNVLRKNSAVEHQTFAMRVHRLIESFHGLGRSKSAGPRSGK